MSEGRRAVVLVAGLALAACGTGAASRAKTQGYTADELLAAGDYDGAARLYSRDIDEGDKSSATAEKLANASVRAATRHADAAMPALDEGNVDHATAEARRAEDFGPGLPIVREAKAKIEARVADDRRAATLRGRAAAVGSSDPQEAARLLDEAAAAAPSSGDVARRHRDATLAAEADRAADRAETAWAAGDRPRTSRELAGARVAERPTAKAQALRRRIEQDVVAASSHADETSLRAAYAFANEADLDASVVALLRDRLADKLVASARDLLDTRRPAVAALLEIEARSLRADVRTPALDRVHDAATTVILVRAFEDGTGGKVDGARIAKALRERINLDASGGGMPLVALDETPASRSANPRALLVAGRVVEARRKTAPLRADSAILQISQLTARVTMTLDGACVWTQDVSASADETSPASAPATDAAAMAAKAADRFAAAAAGGVRVAAEAGPRRFFDAARVAERTGRRDEAAEAYAMYLLATAETASSERTDAARALDELLGVHVALRTGTKRDFP